MLYLGVDLGKAQDYTALVLVEKKVRARSFGTWEFSHAVVRWMERVPLGTPYTEVTERVREIVWHPAVQGDCTVVVDATGLGNPVVEMMKNARLGCRLTAVTITPGGRPCYRAVAGCEGWAVPKRDLIAELQMMFEKQQVEIAKDLVLRPALVKELMDVRATQQASGYVRVGADRHGQHDDLMMALALACRQMKWR